MASRPISVPGQRIYCAHCGQMVTRRTFYEHKRDYYDPASKTWTKRCRRESALTDPTTHESVSTNQVSFDIDTVLILLIWGVAKALY